MRDYPPPSNYANMLSSPQGIRLAFRDKGLQSSSVEPDKLGMPRARSGAFAVVYRLNLPGGGSKAVRLFLKEEDDRQDRYKRIFEHLSRQSLSCLVPFAYEDNAFRAADNKKYPMMTMDWVVGETLYDWLHGRALAGDAKALATIAEKWRHTVKGLRDAKIAHGDLQHANVMVTKTGEIKLVDYDGMCVPALVGRRNLEIGVDPYQHPGRNGDTQLSLGLDNFSAIFIYVALRALAADPRLWNDFVVAKQYDKMMLTRQDLEEPGKSPLIQRMKRSADPEVQRLTGTLLDLFRGRLDQVPFLEELFVAFDYQQVTAALDRKEFDAAVGMLARNGKQVGQAPPNLQPRLRDAEQRIAKLTELLAAINAGDEQKTLAASASPLLQGYPGAAAGLAMAKDAAAVLMVLRKLETARAGKRWRDLVAEWDAAQPVLTRPAGVLRRSAERYRDDVHLWRTRNEICDRILAMLRSPQPDSGELERLWLSLNGYGGHPECDVKKTAIQGVINARQKPATSPPTLVPATRSGTSGPRSPAQMPPIPSRPATTPMPPAGSRGIPVVSPQAGGQRTVTAAWLPGAGTQSAVSGTRAATPGVVAASPSARPVSPPSGAPGPNPGWNGQALHGGVVATAASSDGSMRMETVAAPPAPPPWNLTAGWLVGKLTNARFDKEVFWLALMCGWRTMLGGFIGGIAGLGAAMAMSKLGQPGLWFAGAGLLLGLIATGVVMGFLHGRDAILGRPTFTVPRWFFVISGAAIIGTTAAVAALVFGAHAGAGMSEDYYAAHFSMGVRLKSFGGAMAWTLLALGIATTVSRAAPNITLGPLTSSALLAGVLSWLAVIGFHDERMGLLLGAMVLGLLTAILVTIAEAASREWFIEYPGGQGRLARINLGSVPVLAGADPASCHVVKPGASIPVSLKYWIESGQPFVMDCAGPQTYRVAAGDRRPLSGMVISVTSLVPEGSRSAAGTASASPGPAVLTTAGPGGSRPAVARPGAIGSPAAAPVAPAARTPPPPAPPPRAGA
jgi:hypothetical protein